MWLLLPHRYFFGLVISGKIRIGHRQRISTMTLKILAFLPIVTAMSAQVGADMTSFGDSEDIAEATYSEQEKASAASLVDADFDIDPAEDAAEDTTDDILVDADLTKAFLG